MDASNMNNYLRNDRFNFTGDEYGVILSAAKIGIWSLEMDEGEPYRLFCNDIMEDLIGAPHGTKPVEAYIAFSNGMLDEYQAALDRYFYEIANFGQSEITYKWKYPDGHIISVRCVGVLDRTYVKGTRFRGYHQDITNTTDLEERLTYEAEHDNQTGLLCRNIAETRIKEIINDGSNNTALLLIDIDNLSSINKNYGHACGDRVIVSIAEGLRAIQAQRPNDIIGRFTGDGFIALTNETESVEKIKEVIESFQKNVSEVRYGTDDYIAPTCSIGIALCKKKDNNSFADLYRKADIALFHAKNKGKNTYEVYTDDMTEFRLNEHVKELEATNSEMRQQLEIIGAMAKVSFNTYYIDIQNNLINILKTETTLDDLISGAGPLDLAIKNMIESLIEPGSVKKVEELVGTPKKIQKLLEKTDDYPFEYERVGGLWVRAHIVAINRDEKGTALSALWIMENIDEEKKQELAVRKAEEESRYLFNSLAANAYAIYKCSLGADTAEMIYGATDAEKKWTKRTTITKLIEGLESEKSREAKEVRDANRAFLDESTVSERLKDTDMLTHDIRTEKLGWLNINIIPHRKDDKGRFTEVLVLVRKVDELKQAELEKAQLEAERSAILSGIGKTFNFMYRIDLKNDMCFEIQAPPHLKGKIPASCSIKEAFDIFDGIDLDDELKQENEDIFNVENLREAFTFSTNIIRDIKFKTYGWAQVCITPLKRDLIGRVDEFLLMCRQIGFEKEQEIIAKRMEQERMTLLNSLSKVYFSINHFNLETGVGEEIYSANESKNLMSVTNFSDAMKYFLEIDKTPALAGDKTEFWNCDTIRERLKDKDIISKEVLTEVLGWVQVHMLVYHRDAEGNATDILWLENDIDAQKTRELKITEELEHAYEDARQANFAKSRFLSSMSHDIRTPMNAIMGMVDIAMRHEDNPEKVHDNLRKIEMAGGQLISLVNDVLDISAIESGKLELRPAENAVKMNFNKLETIFRPQMEQKNIHATFDIHDISYPWIMVDEVRLDQICSNLISNALKYTPEDGSVTVEMFQDTTINGTPFMTFTVSDTGIGMSKEFMEHMWETFSRATDTRINRIQGAGLGLSIVKDLIDKMNGTITVKSAINVGSTFTVVIPITPVDHIDEEDEEGEDFEEALSMHILVAEDNDLNWEIANELLEINGISTERAEDGQKCLQMFTEAPAGTYDAILMDMQMPIMNGCEAAVSIRGSNHPEAKTIPIIAMTANAFADDVARCKEAGMNDHLSKPIDINKVVSTIKRYVNQR